ncbi:MAG TPA: alkaline phosphatase family protein [Blastocatellia bacterium]|nr:alkaline phosphatase family protein [Blastocatellia bacterium]
MYIKKSCLHPALAFLLFFLSFSLIAGGQPLPQAIKFAPGQDKKAQKKVRKRAPARREVRFEEGRDKQTTPAGLVKFDQGRDRAKLVVLIVVDQFRYDFLERFGDQFGKGGFRRLLDGGAVFTNATYDYAPTFTAPGHAAIATGSVPAQNGIVGNAWFDREAGRVRVMVSDNDARLVTSNGPAGEQGAPSPRSLIGTTIGDQMRLANNLQSRVIAMSQKDRSAVLPGGQRPTGAYWFHAPTGTFVTSDYYYKELPAWVKRFNAENRPDKYFGQTWERMLAPDAYGRSQAENLAVQRSALGGKFPYVITGGETKPGPKFYSAFEFTPFVSDYLVEFAKAATEAESLGADQFPDLLSVSFSAPDLVGHYYGPDSQEVHDTWLRLDRTIAQLLDYLDRRVGLANVIIAVTGDHGVAPVPEYMQSLGYDAGRVSGKEIEETANRALAARYGEGKWVQALVNDQLYLDAKLIAERKADPAEAQRVAGEAALSVPGIVNYFTRAQIVEGRMPAGPIARRIMNGFNRARSGDVWVITKPFAFITEGNLATTHGSPYNYDAHVPVIFYGAGVRPGRYSVECSPSDIAPTLAELLGVEPPANRVGRALVDALATKNGH